MTQRTAHPKVHEIFVNRWSPRSFDGSEVEADDLRAIFTAAGLAPSAFNHQPWKFLYACRDDAHWEQFLSLLIPFNQSWARDAGVIVFILSETMHRQGEKSSEIYSHSFDAGAAWAQMALQATWLGYHAHAMTGIEFDKARTELRLPDDIRLEAAAVIGRRASPDRLPEGLREREIPSGRKPVDAITIRGTYR